MSVQTITRSQVGVATTAIAAQAAVKYDPNKNDNPLIKNIAKSFPDTDWTVDLPIERGGTKDPKKPANLAPSKLLNKHVPYIGQNASGTISMYSPVFGAVTSVNAGGSRTELKAEKLFDPLKGVGQLDYSASVLTHAPEIGSSTVIGQVHGKRIYPAQNGRASGSKYLVIVRFVRTGKTTGKIVADINDPTKDKPQKQVVLDAAYKMGTKFNARILFNKGAISILYSAGSKPLAATAVTKFKPVGWGKETAGAYFKVGAYAQRRIYRTGGDLSDSTVISNKNNPGTSLVLEGVKMSGTYMKPKNTD